jgi:pimeloyl-ACP methyl ester carboxylesterase
LLAFTHGDVMFRLLAFALLAAAPLAARAADPIGAAGDGGIAYEQIGRWDADRLNAILTDEAPEFGDVAVTYTPATTGVTLYRVTYPSVIPEQDDRPTVASGLVAVPDGGAGPYPVVSYQHGTVYGKEQVPSFPEQSPETRIVLAQFAGQGFVVIGADYFGLGASIEPDGYMVKASHQQATADMLAAGRKVLGRLGVGTSDELFLAGWSQGGFVTLALLEKLEADGVPVSGAATASAPADVAAALTGLLAFPRENAAAWAPTLFMLSAFSFETYYGVPGLARSVLTEEAYPVARRLYDFEPVEEAEVPTDMRKVVRAELFDPQVFAASGFGRLAAETTAFRTVFRTPVRTYYGLADEVITPGMGRLPMAYQRAIGNDRVEAVPTGETTHRGTFVTAVPAWKAWFDGL